MDNFQDVIFKWIRTYREIFKSALVYLSKNLSVIEWCRLLGGNLKKIITFGTQHFVRNPWHVRYLACPVLEGFTVFELYQGISLFYFIFLLK